MKIRNTILISLLMLAFVVGGCSKERTTNSDGGNTANVTVRLTKSSLAERIDQMRLFVFQDQEMVAQASTSVVDGNFTFGGVILTTGLYTFVIQGVDILPDDAELVVYLGQKDVEIGPGGNPITIDVEPAIPMVRVAPYDLLTAETATFTSKLEIWNIDKFRTGIFSFQIDPAKVSFVGASAANDDWGLLDIVSEVESNILWVTVTRLEGSDLVPARNAIVNLTFSAVAAGEANLAPIILTMSDDLGEIPGLASVYEESQRVRIVGGGGGNRGILTGFVYDATTGIGLAGASVTAIGPESRQALTDETGLFLFEDLQYGTYEVSATLSGYISLSRTVTHNLQVTSSVFALSQQLAAGQFRIVLSWQATPEDLDAHLWTTVGDIMYEVYYGDQGSASLAPFVLLDNDDVDGYGPETITIYQMSSPGIFAVKNYSGDPAITTSGAQVEIYSGNQKIGNYSVPTTGTGIWWYVFDLSPQGVITPKNTISDIPPVPSADGSPAMRTEKRLQ